MNEEFVIDTEALAEEIASYLAAVDTFRAAQCEPTWRPEVSESAIDRTSLRPAAAIERSAH